jgi:hypothetical protein
MTMADPRANGCLLMIEEVEQEVDSPGRSTRSRTAASSAASPADKSTKKLPPPLPGKKAQKRILFDQIDDANDSRNITPPPPLAPVPAPMQAQPHHVCDWAQAVICNFPQLPPLKCQNN